MVVSEVLSPLQEGVETFHCSSPSGSSAEEIFKKLGEEFRIDPKVIEYMVKELKLMTLADFAYLFSAQCEVEPER